MKKTSCSQAAPARRGKLLVQLNRGQWRHFNYRRHLFEFSEELWWNGSEIVAWWPDFLLITHKYIRNITRRIMIVSELIISQLLLFALGSGFCGDTCSYFDKAVVTWTFALFLLHEVFQHGDLLLSSSTAPFSYSHYNLLFTVLNGKSEIQNVFLFYNQWLKFKVFGLDSFCLLEFENYGSYLNLLIRVYLAYFWEK